MIIVELVERPDAEATDWNGSDLDLGTFIALESWKFNYSSYIYIIIIITHEVYIGY